MLTERFKRRQWGFWLVLLDRKHFKVKLLRFKRGRALSMQYHKYRSELWLILYGIGSGTFKHFRKGETHTFYALVPTLVLEIQYGDKCEESDIVRL